MYNREGDCLMRKYFVKTTAIAMTAALAFGAVSMQNADAAKAPKLDKKNVSVKVGQKKTIKVKNGKKAAKVTWKSNKPAVVKVMKKVTAGNKAVTIKAVKEGSAKITAAYKLKGVSKKMKCKVKVTGNTLSASPAPTAVTPAPVVTPTPAPAPTAAPTPVPTAMPTPTAKIITANDAIVEKNIPSDFKDKKDGVEYGEFIVNAKYYSDITDSERTVNIALPAGYDESKKYPVVYMMHGIGCTKEMFGTNIDGSSIAKIYANLRAEGKCEEMILVFPGIRVSDEPENDMHSTENYKHYDDFREDLINNLMPYMEENYAVATGRENTAVCGWSMGGREALYIGLSRPDLFGFTAGYCPAFGLLPYSNPAVGKSEPGLLAVEGAEEDTITLPEEYINNTYVQISAGIYDDVVNDEPKRYHNALETGGVPHIYNEYPSGHSDGVYDPGFYILIMNAFKTVE